MAAEIPRWFDAAISSGLQQLLVLYLPGAPAEETICAVAEMWSRAVWTSRASWDERLDVQRIAAAFLALARRVDRWPAPKQILDSLPPRPERAKLPEPPLSRDQIERNKAFLRRLTAMVLAPKETRRVTDDMDAFD